MLIQMNMHACGKLSVASECFVKQLELVYHQYVYICVS